MNTQTNSLFGNINTGGLFGSNNRNNNTGGLFGNNNTGGLFGSNSNITGGLFGNNNSNGKFSNFEKLINKRSNKIQNYNKFIKCNHADKYCAFYTGGYVNLVCYECIYEYNLDKNKCIPINNKFNSYIDIYQENINEMKNKINNVIINEINNLELDKNDNINSIFEKIDLKFNLPIEVSFEERLKIGIKRKIINILNNIVLDNRNIFESYLNLYCTKLENLKTECTNLYEKEIIKLESEIPFTLKGIAIPKINEEFQNNIKLSLNKEKLVNPFEIKDNIDNIDIDTTFEEDAKNNLTLIRFKKDILIENKYKYELTISGIKGCTYINNEEVYNIHNKILIETENENSILACLII